MLEIIQSSSLSIDLKKIYCVEEGYWPWIGSYFGLKFCYGAWIYANIKLDERYIFFVNEYKGESINAVFWGFWIFLNIPLVYKFRVISQNPMASPRLFISSSAVYFSSVIGLHSVFLCLKIELIIGKENF